MKVSKDKIIKIAITLILLLVIVLLAIYIQKNEVLKLAEDKAQEQIKAEVQDDIQSIIDDTKSSVEQNESREATISDLKEELKALGYILDETTGRFEYSGYIITVDENLNIVSVEEIQTEAYYRVMSVDGENLDILLTIENPKGIDKIMAEDITVEGNGKEIVAIDRTLKEGEEYQLRLKIVGEESEELYTLVASTNPNIVITNEDTLGDGTTKTIEIQYPDNENLINYYSIDNEKTWQEYTGTFDLTVTENFKLSAKSEWEEGKTIPNIETQFIARGDSILSVTENYINNEAHGIIYVNDEIYTAHTYVMNKDTIIAKNTTYGDAGDVATESTDAQNMVIVKVDGDLTINEGVTVGPYTSNYGGPKGFLVYCTETLTNNGTIHNNYGAKAAGQNVYLWKNEDGSYEYVPAEGTAGGARQSVGGSTAKNGNAGASATASTYISGSGVKRATAGGGAGGVASGSGGYTQNGSIGGTGTSYGAGAGGGGAAGCHATVVTSSDAKTTLGGSGAWKNAQYNCGKPSVAGGGAGVVPGTGYYQNGWSQAQFMNGYQGGRGTGGLLIIYAKNLQINDKGVFTSIGANGGAAYGPEKRVNTGCIDPASGGGASGGGSINIFTQAIIDLNNTISSHVNVSGGNGGVAYYAKRKATGGAGGTGSCNIGYINSGTYESYYSNN